MLCCPLFASAAASSSFLWCGVLKIFILWQVGGAFILAQISSGLAEQKWAHFFSCWDEWKGGFSLRRKKLDWGFSLLLCISVSLSVTCSFTGMNKRRKYKCACSFIFVQQSRSTCRRRKGSVLLLVLFILFIRWESTPKISRSLTLNNRLLHHLFFSFTKRARKAKRQQQEERVR